MSRAKTTAEETIQWLFASPKEATMTEASLCSAKPIAHASFRRLLLHLESSSDVLWTNGEVVIPVHYRLYDKKRGGKSKNDHFTDILEQAA